MDCAGTERWKPPTYIKPGKFNQTHYPEYIQPDMEHIEAYIRPPWWKLAATTAIQMAATLFEEKIQEYSNVHIFTDNQSAIQAIESPKQQSGQYIIKSILDKIDKIQEAKPMCNIYIEWVPGHKDIEGNEQADQ